LVCGLVGVTVDSRTDAACRNPDFRVQCRVHGAERMRSPWRDRGSEADRGGATL